MKRKVLHIIDSFTLGGAETILLGVANNLTDFDHIIVALRPNDQFENHNHTIISLNYTGKFSIPRCVRSLKNIIIKENIELIHANLLTSTFIARLAKPSKVKLVFSVHNLLSKSAFKISKVSWLIEKMSHSKNEHALFVSKAVRDDYNRTIGIKSTYDVLYNYVEDSFFQNNYSIRKNILERPCFISVGRLKEQKNYEFLIEALHHLDRMFSMTIYGEGHLHENLKKSIEYYNLVDHIKLNGLSHELEEEYLGCDIYVMNSHYEGFGIAPMEASAIGTPCLLPNIPVLKEIFGESALFYKKDDKIDFNNKLNLLVEDYPLRRDLSEKGRLTAAKVSKKSTYMDSLKGIYNDLIYINK